MCLASFLAGIATMEWLENYSGIVMVTQSERSRQEVDFKACKQELGECRTEVSKLRTVRTHQPESLSTEWSEMKRELGKLRTESAARASQLREAEASNRELLSRLRETEVPNVPQSAEGIATPVAGYPPTRIAPNNLVSFLDGTLTVAAHGITPMTTCLIATNMDNCKDVAVGQTLRVNIGRKVYGLRVDKIDASSGYVLSSVNSVTITLVQYR
jgi:ribosomal protein L29